MSTKKISQREARRLRKRAQAAEATLNALFNRWSSSPYPGGVSTRVFSMNETSQAVVELARRLGCALIAVPDGDKLAIYAVQRPTK